MQRIFGFDIGTTSIGFAVVDLEEQEESGAIKRLGVRIFPEARDPDGTPLNQQRRAKRMARRQLRRRRERRRALNELLADHGLLPGFNSAEWPKIMAADPYELRARGLNEPLSAHELGRALYHLSKRRHFLERDLAEAEEKAEKDKAKPEEEAEAKSRDAVIAELKKSGETLGSHLARKAALAAERARPKAVEAEARGLCAAEGRDYGLLGTNGRKRHNKYRELARKRLACEQAYSVLSSGQASQMHSDADPPLRGIHATRAIVQEEFEKLCAAQAAHHPVLSEPDFHAALHDAIFFQRPVFWRKSTLGKCRFIPDAPLCPKGSWLSQQRRMLEKVNNLAIAGGNARPLDEEERAAILTKLQVQGSMSWGGVRDALKPLFKCRGESSKTIRFNLEYGDEKGGLKGNIVEASLAKILGPKWAAHPHKEAPRAFIPEALWQADYGETGTQRVVIRSQKEREARRAALAQRLIDEFGLSRDEAGEIIKLHFPQGWEPFSAKALQIFLLELEKPTREPVRFGALLNGPEWESWRNANFPDRERPTGELFDKLPSPRQREETKRIARLRNPTVVRVQNELRKVANNLISLYGKPDFIRVELARDVGKSKREREEIQSKINKNKRKRDEARKDLEAKGIADPSRDDIEKWLLWKESQERCPYTGDQIGFDDLFQAGRYQIEHIWPRSLSLDDSFRNKTLCRKDVNIAKGNRTPYEFFRGRDAEWNAVKDRISKMVGRDGMLPGKAKRFVAKEMPDDFATRQLNDTGYAAREAIAFLKRLLAGYRPQRAGPCAGRHRPGDSAIAQALGPQQHPF